MVKGILSDEEARTRLTGLRAEKAELQAKVESLPEAPKVVALQPALVANYLRGVEQLDQLLRDGQPSTPDVARAVRDLVSKVIVHPPGEDGRPEIEVQGYLSELINPTLGQKLKCRGGLLVAEEGFEPPTQGL